MSSRSRDTDCIIVRIWTTRDDEKKEISTRTFVKKRYADAQFGDVGHCTVEVVLDGQSHYASIWPRNGLIGETPKAEYFGPQESQFADSAEHDRRNEEIDEATTVVLFGLDCTAAANAIRLVKEAGVSYQVADMARQGVTPAGTVVFSCVSLTLRILEDAGVMLNETSSNASFVQTVLAVRDYVVKAKQANVSMYKDDAIAYGRLERRLMARRGLLNVVTFEGGERVVHKKRRWKKKEQSTGD